MSSSVQPSAFGPGRRAVATMFFGDSPHSRPGRPAGFAGLLRRLVRGSRKLVLVERRLVKEGCDLGDVIKDVRPSVGRRWWRWADSASE